MKTLTRGIIGTLAVFLTSGIQSHAVVGQAIEIQGTNLVLSWPSLGYEYYVIQHRPTLDESTPWQELTNCLPANSTNRTTYVIPGVVILPPGAGGGGGGAGDPPPDPGDSTQEGDGEPTEPMVIAADGSPPLVPLVLYPPGFDLSDFLIYDPAVSDWVRGSEYVREESFTSSLDESETDDGGGESSVTSGFYRVFHVPDFAFNVTNYAYDGPWFLPVDFKDYMDRVENIEVLLNGEPTSDAVFMPYVYENGETNWGIGITFDLFPNGTYQIQLRTTLNVNDLVGDETIYLVLTNLIRDIVVDNEVTFTNWEGLILTNNFIYKAQTKNPNTDWWIDLFDVWEEYVITGSGHTTNGLIEWMWDLRDWQGNLRDNLDYDPFFYAQITFDTAGGAEAGQTNRPAPSPQIEYPNVGYWLVTYLDRHFLDVATNSNYPGVQEMMEAAVNVIAGGPASRGIPYSVFPIKFGTNIYTQAQRNDSWAELKARLFMPQNRNLYYYGHGNANTIGCDIHAFSDAGAITGAVHLAKSKARLQSQIVKNELTFNRYGGSRPYRFVWLDGCSTAAGGWPDAFGVDKAGHDIGWYTSSTTNPKHRRPSAFVGWNKPVGFGDGWGSAQASFNFRSEWMQDWYYYWTIRGLWQAFDNACDAASWPPNRQTQLWGTMRVYGYTNLLMNGYNQKTDWRWP